ncbi:hypothetical protein IQ269_22825 [Tychonema sp. LEGE 07199]|uniref:hypothetical protein n=1 Tax=unclassified Tychonema TaxID=2642144 RepID=UPI001880E80F|nr:MULTISPECIES: hypothetical protein [unclassified Tychonema]MBE9123554.1 hypothetical protein [Tychonema sp. LEGE 07199]MBE9131396.1 hypothetical protein [Tychonema sp. LEGE 07196]
MEVSTFEILTKPIAPVIGIPPELIPVARRVVQGYFLTISNLEAIDLRYRIEFTVSLPVPADPNKILLNNAILVVDVEGNNTPVTLTQQPGKPKVYRGFFTIPAHKTASVELLPILPGSLTPGLLEVRGYVSLFLPPRRSFPFSVPQSEKPVKVLLNPEIRGTFLPNGFPSVPNPSPDFDQISYTLAIASGKALNEIPPEPGQPIIIHLPIVAPILEELRNGTLDLPSLDADNSEKAQMLVQLLAQIDTNDVNLKELNTVMDKFDIPVRMSRS